MALSQRPSPLCPVLLPLRDDTAAIAANDSAPDKEHMSVPLQSLQQPPEEEHTDPQASTLSPSSSSCSTPKARHLPLLSPRPFFSPSTPSEPSLPLPPLLSPAPAQEIQFLTLSPHASKTPTTTITTIPSHLQSPAIPPVSALKLCKDNPSSGVPFSHDPSCTAPAPPPPSLFPHPAHNPPPPPPAWPSPPPGAHPPPSAPARHPLRPLSALHPCSEQSWSSLDATSPRYRLLKVAGLVDDGAGTGGPGGPGGGRTR
ncbi:hypothetical protein MKZ38_002140 [Zalerion maritima]|uniref:Uncharacterized protein n=1 Tax=Zalerion maritima TaxID=339359 RepID=A0AAD5RPB7_9PEZI|nr:hypothetical protein MKZ38_002140 [Zalerion maritima]